MDHTEINSVAAGDVDGDGGEEILTVGQYYDGARLCAQLVIWNGSTLEVEGVLGWYWLGNTTINSVALGNVDVDAPLEIVLGGRFHDGVRWYWVDDTTINSVAIGDVDGDVEIGGQFDDETGSHLIVWDGSTLGFEAVTGWSGGYGTCIRSVAVGDVDEDEEVEIVTGGAHNDDARNLALLAVWRKT